MVEMRWINTIFILLLSEAWSRETGTSQSPTVSPTASNRPSQVFRHAAFFNLGSGVDLNYSNKTWDEILYVIWNIYLKRMDIHCKISFRDGGQNLESCNDGKSLRNTTSAQSYLHIPNFSENDEGLYKCEVAYNGGVEFHEISVAATVPPRISSWIDHTGNRAVCRAERGKPAARIRWTQSGNSSSEEKEETGFFTVVSDLELTEGMDTEHLRCVISHPYWEEEKNLIPESSKGSLTWLIILVATVMAVVLAAVLYFAQTKLTKMRQCQQSDSSAHKSAPDVEEVEPYASYVQRVNSIYNSSLDLFS